MKTLLGMISGAAFVGAASLAGAAPSVTDNGQYSLEYVGQSANGTLVDFSWQITKLTADDVSLGHVTFAIDFSQCAPEVPLQKFIAGGSVTQGAITDNFVVLLVWQDPDTGLEGVSFTGLHWLDDAEGASATLTLTLDASKLPAGYSFGIGAVDFATKAGAQSICGCSTLFPGFGTTLGPVCKPDKPEEPKGPKQGLTPGYWKNHLSAWPAPFNASTTVAGAGFVGSLYQDVSLSKALDGGGGPGVAGAQKILLRAAAAALLNATSSNVNYPLSSAQVLAQTNAAIASGDRGTMLELAATLDAYNNLGL